MKVCVRTFLKTVAGASYTAPRTVPKGLSRVWLIFSSRTPRKSGCRRIPFNPLSQESVSVGITGIVLVRVVWVVKCVSSEDPYSALYIYAYASSAPCPGYLRGFFRRLCWVGWKNTIISRVQVLAPCTWGSWGKCTRGPSSLPLTIQPPWRH
jgi:hypothetical protein